MEINNNIKDFRKSLIPEKPYNNIFKYEQLSEYIKLNMLSFQNVQNNNYKISKYNFKKCVELSKEIDELKYSESLINYSIILYLNEELQESYNTLLKAKEISTKIYENSDSINQIYFIHLRILSNISLISMSLNDISNSKKYFYECISLIKEPKIKDTQIQISMLHELLYIFFRLDSLNKFHEINTVNEEQIDNNYDSFLNNQSLSSINFNVKFNDKGLYNLHKSIKENNIKYWLQYLDEEIKEIKINEDAHRYIFLLINRIAALYSDEENYDKNNINNLLKLLAKYYKDKFGNNIILKDNSNNFYKILFEFKNKFYTAVEYYQQLIKLEKELQFQAFELKINNKNNNKKENKILIKLLFKNALNNLDNATNNQNYIKINEIKKQIEYAMNLVESNKINWNLLSIINIDQNLIKNINILFHNLKIIRIKSVLRYNFHKYKLRTLGYISMKDKMKKKYIKVENFLKKQLLNLQEGAILLKYNFSSKGFSEHFYKINITNDDYYFCIHKTISEIKPYKIFNLEELYDITIGFESQNLITKIKPKQNFFKNYKPWYFLSFWFEERTIDLYFDNDEEMNKWFEGIYFYNKYILDKKTKNLNYFFFKKLKLKLLYRLKNMKNDLEIIKQLKYYESKNYLEYQSLPFYKVLVLFYKVCEKINE